MVYFVANYFNTANKSIKNDMAEQHDRTPSARFDKTPCDNLPN